MRIGGSTSCIGSGQNDLRFGDVEAGLAISDTEACSCWRSAAAKLRDAGLRGGVVSPLGVGRTMVFLQRSHIPEAYVMGCLHVLQMATVFEGVATCVLLNLKSKLDLVVVIDDESLLLRMSPADER
jgi:hypothetical protein